MNEAAARQIPLESRAAASYTGSMIIPFVAMVPMVAAAGWAFLYYLCGGGLGGAVLIFIVLKLLGR